MIYIQNKCREKSMTCIRKYTSLLKVCQYNGSAMGIAYFLKPTFSCQVNCAIPVLSIWTSSIPTKKEIMAFFYLYNESHAGPISLISTVQIMFVCADANLFNVYEILSKILSKTRLILTLNHNLNKHGQFFKLISTLQLTCKIIQKFKFKLWSFKIIDVAFKVKVKSHESWNRHAKLNSYFK